MVDSVARRTCSYLQGISTQQRCEELMEACENLDPANPVLVMESGTVNVSNSKTCSMMVPTLLRLGHTLKKADQPQPQPAAPKPEPQPEPEPQPAPQPQPQPKPAPRKSSWASLGSPTRQAKPVETAEPGEAVETPASAPAESSIIKPFTAQLIADNRKMVAKRTLLLGNGKGARVEVEYSVGKTESPEIFEMAYDLKLNGEVLGNKQSLRFRAPLNKISLQFEITPSAEQSGRIQSIRIIEMQ